MKRSLKTFKITGAIALSVGSLSLFFAGIHSNAAKEAKADIDYSTATSYHNSGSSYSLFTTLQTLTFTTKTWDYGDLWTLYGSCFYKDSPNGKIKDYYSNTTNYTYSTNQCGSYSGEGSCYNREHSVPKSWWGGSETKQGADPFIVFPTDGYVNNRRSNYPFGVVSSTTYTSNNKYSKLGSANSSYGYSGTVFEPADEVKGDFARLVFYACVRYSSSTSNYASQPTYKWTSAEGTSTFSGSAPTSSNFNGFCLTNYAIKLFTEWHNKDKPDEWERNLNDRIYSKQSNRNPFVDHPEYVNTLWGKITSANPTIYSDGTGVTISKSTISLTPGSTTTISATSSNNSNITWSTSNSSVASISPTSSSSGSNITITAGSTGSATITAKATINNTQYTQTCSVTVSNVQPSITLNKSMLTLSVGETETLVATTANGSGNVTWSSSDDGVVTVTSGGKVEGISAGSATITALYSGVSATCDVTITSSGSIIEGDSETLDFTAQNYGNAATVTSLSGVSCDATLSKGTGSNDPKYYTSGDAMRCYPGNTITISSTGNKIVKIEFVFGSSDGSNTITSSPATYSNGTWTGNAQSVTFTIGGTSGNRRIAKIIVTYEGTEVPSFSYETGIGYLMSFTNSSNSTKYFIGTLSDNNYGNTSTAQTDAMTMYFEENGDDYHMYFINSSKIKNYIYVSGGKLALSTSKPSVSWNEDSNGLYCTVSSTKYYIGGNGSYTTFGVYTSTSVYHAQFTETETAETWATDFLSLVTCNGGATAPNTTNWAATKTKYLSLTTLEQGFVTSEMPNENGNNIQQALARYVFIVNKYTNRTNYPDYLSKASQANRMDLMVFPNDTTSILLVVFAISLLAIGTTFISIYFKKKKER